jgi:hypothetical protein
MTSSVNSFDLKNFDKPFSLPMSYLSSIQHKEPATFRRVARFQRLGAIFKIIPFLRFPFPAKKRRARVLRVGTAERVSDA